MSRRERGGPRACLFIARLANVVIVALKTTKKQDKVRVVVITLIRGLGVGGELIN